MSQGVSDFLNAKSLIKRPGMDSMNGHCLSKWSEISDLMQMIKKCLNPQAVCTKQQQQNAGSVGSFKESISYLFENPVNLFTSTTFIQCISQEVSAFLFCFFPKMSSL